jgi:putative inorganic carbon (hco3(-)) transporter
MARGSTLALRERSDSTLLGNEPLRVDPSVGPAALSPGAWPRSLLVILLTLGLACGALIAWTARSTAADGMLMLAVLAAPLAVAGAAAVFTRPILGVMVVLACLPIALNRIPTVLDLKLIQIVTLIVAALTVFRRVTQGLSPLPWAPQMWLWLLFLAGSVIATPSALDVAKALREDALVAIGLLLALVVFGAVRSMGDVRASVATLLAVGAGMVLYGLWGTSTLEPTLGATVVENRPHAGFDSPNGYGGFSAFILVVAVGATLGARTRATRLGAGLTMVLCLVALSLSLSRGAWIGAAVAIVGVLILLPEARRTFLLTGAGAVVCLFLIASVLPLSPQLKLMQARITTLADPAGNPYDARPLLWREAVRQIADDPWTGQGPGNFAEASLRGHSVATNIGLEHAHNALLTVAAQDGLPNALLLAGFTVVMAVTLRRTVRRLADLRDRALLVGVGCACLVPVAQGLFDYGLRGPRQLMMLASVTGIILAVSRLVPSPVKP